MRPNRKRQPTPKGEASKSLDHARVLLKELEALSDPDQKQSFVGRLNDFLRSSRTVTNYLPNETGRKAGLEAWTKAEIKALRKKDSSFAFFNTLRTISEHDCLVEPARANISVGIAEQIVLRGSVEMELRDVTSGEVLANVSQAAPPGVEGTVTRASISTKYFLGNGPNEDIVTLCKAVVATLDSLVNQAYRLYP